MTDPVDLAREVVGRDGQDIAAVLAAKLGIESQTLARAVIAVAELADRLDAEAADDFDGVSGTSVSLVKYETAKAIRAALNGGHRG